MDVEILKKSRISIVVPCYNEEEVLRETSKRLQEVLDDMVATGVAHPASNIFFVDDGSKDNTWSLIEEFAAGDTRIKGVKLSRNRGHQNALIAGLQSADGDAVISVDADLQDDVGVIKQMASRFNEGYEIVYGVRSSRTTDTFFKRKSAESYYLFLNLLGVDVVFNHADYRLMSRRVLECLHTYSEVNLFLRGIVPLLGFRSTQVSYERAERFAGESKYPLSKMLGLALDGVTSFSAFPLRVITTLGILVCIASLGFGAWAAWTKLFGTTAIPGWASTVIPVYLLGGIQLLCIGVIGEYLSKIYLEVKRRPRYFIEKLI